MFNRINLLGLFLIFPYGILFSEYADFHGAFSQSYLKTTSNDFVLEDSKEGTFEYTEALFNASAQVTDKLRVGAQLISRSFGEEGHFKTSLDWAFGDYRHNDLLGLRAGKVKLPVGFYNESRDVDFARTQVLLDQGVYNEVFRSFIIAYEGLGLYGTFEPKSQKLGSFDYNFYTGTMDIPDEIEPIKLLHAIDPSTQLESRAIWGAAFIWNTPIEGFRLGASHARYRGEIDLQLSSVTYYEAFLLDVSLTTLSLEWIWKKLTLSAEHQLFQLDSTVTTTLPGVSGAAASGIVNATLENDNKAWYLSAVYQWNHRFSTHLSYGEDAADKSKFGDINVYRKDINFGYRYDLNDHWIWKGEYHSMRGKGGATSHQGNGISDTWGLFITRLTFTF